MTHLVRHTGRRPPPHPTRRADCGSEFVIVRPEHAQPLRAAGPDQGLGAQMWLVPAWLGEAEGQGGGAPPLSALSSVPRPSGRLGALPWPEQPSGRPAGPAPATSEGFEPGWLAPGPPGHQRPHAGPPSLPEPRLGRAPIWSWSPDWPGPADGGGHSVAHNPTLGHLLLAL